MEIHPKASINTMKDIETEKELPNGYEVSYKLEVGDLLKIPPTLHIL